MALSKKQQERREQVKREREQREEEERKAQYELSLLKCWEMGRVIFDRADYMFKTVPEQGPPVLIKVSAEERAFLVAIDIAEVDEYGERDITPILAYADWLEEHRMFLPALMIRHRIALAVRAKALRKGRKPKPKPRWLEIEQRLNELVKKQTSEAGREMLERRRRSTVRCRNKIFE